MLDKQQQTARRIATGPILPRIEFPLTACLAYGSRLTHERGTRQRLVEFVDDHDRLITVLSCAAGPSSGAVHEQGSRTAARSDVAVDDSEHVLAPNMGLRRAVGAGSAPPGGRAANLERLGSPLRSASSRTTRLPDKCAKLPKQVKVRVRPHARVNIMLRTKCK